jgi:hypothetical protein
MSPVRREWPMAAAVADPATNINGQPARWGHGQPQASG